MSRKVVQITDLHLFEDPRECLRDVPTWETFGAVLEQVDRMHGDFDALIITGDIAQDERTGTYRLLREALGSRLGRCRLVPGNHDSRPGLREVFPELFPDRQNALTFCESVGQWTLIGLDTQITGEITGGMDPLQLQWLARELDARRRSPTLIFMHHPPMPINVEWLDTPAFREAEALQDLLTRAPQVKVVCAGHVHQVFEGTLAGARVFTTPSTCVQFAPSPESAIDPLPAGYRVFELDGASLRSEVHRLQDDG